MNSTGKSTFCIVMRNKTCISTRIINLIYVKLEKSQLLSIETIKQELCKPEKKEQQIELDEEQEKNPYETLLI